MSASLSTITMAKNPKILQAGQMFVNSYLNRQPPVEVNKLTNGLKVATQEGGSLGMATVSLHSKTGGRFDTEETNGLSHLMQRAMWQGTQSKSAAQIREALSGIGRLRMDQGREVQSVSIDCPAANAAKAVELLADVARNPKFDAQGVEVARAEALDALKDDENSVSAQVLGNLYRNAYETTRTQAGAGLSLNPYGSAQIKTLTPEQVTRFHEQFSTIPSSMALVATGDVKASEILEKAEQGFGNMAKKEEALTDKRYVGGCVRVSAGKPAFPFTNHVSLGWEICPASSCDVLPLRLLTEVFGQYDRFMNDMTSNWGIRFNIERQATQHGKQPLEEVKPFFETFSDTGLMGFYFNHNLGEGREEGYHFLVALQNEWIRYCMRLNPYQVEVGKNLLKNKVLFEQDGSAKANAVIGKQLVSAGAYTPIEQAFARINDLSTQQVSDTINHYYYDREPTLSSWGIYYTLPVFNTARRNMYKWRY